MTGEACLHNPAGRDSNLLRVLLSITRVTVIFSGLFAGFFFAPLSPLPAVAFPPVEAMEVPAGTVRLDEQHIPHTQGTIEVPVWIKNSGDADGLRIQIDYDEVFLGYAWYRATSANWHIEHFSHYGHHSVTFILKQNPKSNPALVAPLDEEVALTAVFYAKSAAVPVENAKRPFQIRTRLGLGQRGPNGGSDTFFFKVTDREDQQSPVQTDLLDGALTIYYREGVEIGSGGFTPVGQTFRLPLYLTYLHPGREAEKPRTFTVAIDYDEVFLGLVGIMGRSPPVDAFEPDASPIPVLAQSSGIAIFNIALPADAGPLGCRVHVADVYFKYSGLVPPGGLLHVDPSIIQDTGASPEDTKDDPFVGPDNDKPDGGAAAMSPGQQAGVIEVLPPFFVRGNVDSSLQVRNLGISYQPSPTDALLILETVFLGGNNLPCADAADVNDDGRLDLSDAVTLLNHLFRSGPPPAAPYPTPGTDPLPSDSFDCETPVPYFILSR